MTLQSALQRIDALETRVDALAARTGMGTPAPGFGLALAAARHRAAAASVPAANSAPSQPTTLALQLPGVVPGSGVAAVGGPSDERLTPELRATIGRIAARHKVPAALVLGVARAESGFNPRAVSSAGARGMMQLMPQTGAGLGVRDPFDPEQSIEGGTRYLANALRIFHGDLKRAVASYNAGVGAVQRHGGIPPYPETQQYVSRVLAYARSYGLEEPLQM